MFFHLSLFHICPNWKPSAGMWPASSPLPKTAPAASKYPETREICQIIKLDRVAYWIRQWQYLPELKSKGGSRIGMPSSIQIRYSHPPNTLRYQVLSINSAPSPCELRSECNMIQSPDYQRLNLKERKQWKVKCNNSLVIRPHKESESKGESIERTSIIKTINTASSAYASQHEKAYRVNPATILMIPFIESERSNGSK